MGTYRNIIMALRPTTVENVTEAMQKAQSLFEKQISAGTFPTLTIAPFQQEVFRVMESGKPYSIRANANCIHNNSSKIPGNRFTGPMVYMEKNIPVSDSVIRPGGLYTGRSLAIAAEMDYYKIRKQVNEDEASRMVKQAGWYSQASQEWDGINNTIPQHILQQIEKLNQQPEELKALVEASYVNPTIALVGFNFFRMENQRQIRLLDITGSDESQRFFSSVEKTPEWEQICTLLGEQKMTVRDAILDPDFAPVAKSLGYAVAASLSIDGIQTPSARYEGQNPKATNTFFSGKDGESLNYLKVSQEGVILPSNPKPVVAVVDVNDSTPPGRPDERLKEQ